jgi:Sec-independent protein secretion pathway component TatC
VVSQCLMAGPMLALYGLSILVAWGFAKKGEELA